MFLNAAVYTRFVRASMSETMSEDYVCTARANGAPGTRVTLHHVLRNSLLPTVTMMGMDSLSLGGAVFTETVFNLHGLGQDLGCAQRRSPLAGRHHDLRHAVRDRLQLHRRRLLRVARPAHPSRRLTRLSGRRSHRLGEHGDGAAEGWLRRHRVAEKERRLADGFSAVLGHA
jgi:Binding-protein-dependent transport system inner membrane component